MKEQEIKKWFFLSTQELQHLNRSYSSTTQRNQQSQSRQNLQSITQFQSPNTLIRNIQIKRDQQLDIMNKIMTDERNLILKCIKDYKIKLNIGDLNIQGL